MPKAGTPGPRPVGLTAASGWELGLRRTLAIEPKRAWAFLASPEGTELILGKAVDLDPDGPGRANQEGSIAWELTTFSPGSHFRMKWKREAWTGSSILQVRIIPAATGTTIAIHQEGLPDGQAREAMLAHWNGVMDSLALALL